MLKADTFLLTLVAVATAVAAIIAGTVFSTTHRDLHNNRNFQRERDHLDLEMNTTEEEGTQAASLFFIYGFIQELLDGLSYAGVVNTGDIILDEVGHILSLQRMEELWNEALQIRANCLDVLESPNSGHRDGNNIPVVLVNGYANNPIVSGIIRTIFPRLENNAQNAEEGAEDVHMTRHARAMLEDLDNAQTFLHYDANIGLIQGQIDAMENQARIVNTGYRINGLAIFSLYLVLCVFSPLIAFLCIDICNPVWEKLEIVFTSLFVAVSIYLIWFICNYTREREVIANEPHEIAEEDDLNLAEIVEAYIMHTYDTQGEQSNRTEQADEEGLSELENIVEQLTENTPDDQDGGTEYSVADGDDESDDGGKAD